MDEIGGDEQNERFSAARWLRKSAEAFLQCVATSGEARRRAATMSKAITAVADPSWYREPTGDVARKLPEALKSCDALKFDEVSEATAYAGLHLLDRYGRVMQVLEYLVQVGRLPIRKKGVKVLEVGAGPAPALYATRDFYAMLRDWPGRGGAEVAPVRTSHSLERGKAWDRVLHHVSEHLMRARHDDSQVDSLPFSRSVDDFTGFDTTARHHKSIAERARNIFEIFDEADEYITRKAASRIAYQEGSYAPSAYDLIFMCNFLTQPEMTERFAVELTKLSAALTPGGILVVMGGTGKQYPAIYDDVRQIAFKSRLTEIGPPAPLDPNLWPHLDIVSDHMRHNVELALDECFEDERKAIRQSLPRDLWDAKSKFVLPKFQTLVFVRQTPRKREPTVAKSTTTL
jgi:hypothetical protein